MGAFIQAEASPAQVPDGNTGLSKKIIQEFVINFAQPEENNSEENGQGSRVNQMISILSTLLFGLCVSVFSIYWKTN